MKRAITAAAMLLLFSINVNSQTIVASYPFTNYSQYNSFWGITGVGDTLRIGTDNNGSIYKVTKTGQIIDSLVTAVNFNHGLVWDGTAYWVAQDFRTAGAYIYRINTSGQKIDSILCPPLIGGASGGIGGICLKDGGMWFTVYSPDFTVYPFSYAYRIDMSSRQVTDTIPLLGRQVQGIAIKGDTIFYVNDYFHTTPFVDVERIYAYRKATGDTLFSFPTPDPNGDCSPRGLHWDGQYLWLVADRIGNNVNLFKTLYKYSIAGEGNPQIITSVNSLDFGNTIIGNFTERTVTVTNSGTAKLIISNLQITNSRFTMTPMVTPDTLNPSQSRVYTLRFSPTVFDTTSGQLRITSNDAVTPVKSINLYGKGVYNGGFIASNVSSIDYQQRRVNSLCGGYVNITNQGSAPISISAVNFNTTRYRLDTLGLTFPVQIDTQRTKTFRIWFNPTSATSFTDTAKFVSNAVNNQNLRIPLSGTGNSALTALGDIAWQGQIPDNPNTTVDDFQIMAMKEIPDVNQDGINDVIVCSDNYWTLCYNGNSSVTSDILWQVNTRTSSNVSGSVVYEEGLQIVDDINSDGIKDVIFGTGGNNELVYAVSGRNGQILWTYGDSSITADGDINGLSIAKDYSGDGIKDVLIAATGEGEGNGRHSAICVNILNGNQIFIASQLGHFTYSAAATTSGGAISFSSNGGPWGINGFSNNGSYTWTYNLTSAGWHLEELPDVNSDGITDIAAFVGFSGTTAVISGTDGSQIWTYNQGSSINGYFRLAQDIAGDGFPDLISSGPRILHRIDCRSSNIFWTAPLDGNYIHGVDELTDVDGDGVKDIVAGTQNSNLYVVSGDSGRTLFTYNFGSATTNTVEQVSRLKSIDGNNSAEFLGGSRTGKLICFSGGQNSVVGIVNSNTTLPDKFSLSQNYPNPFNPVTKIRFDLPSGFAGKNVKLSIYNTLGALVKVVVNSSLPAGSYEVDFNAVNLASGAYFYKLEAGDFVDTKRMVVIK
ncbi:MAG: choice-of-anchor D domain-containing protein [Ignavibacteria bacterium]|nr:choice-of-anchor D domain-containing protein [Ignavibacteria bacterium]